MLEKAEQTKARRIAQELMMYFFTERVRDFMIHVDFEEDELIITARGQMDKEPSNIEYIKKLLNVERMAEVEDYYDSLLNTDHCGTDYSILASMVDSADIDFDDGVLTFEVVRKIYS